MLPNPYKFCRRCEKEVTGAGGYVLLPETEAIEWFCFPCAIDYVKESTKKDIKTIGYKRIGDDDTAA